MDLPADPEWRLATRVVPSSAASSFREKGWSPYRVSSLDRTQSLLRPPPNDFDQEQRWAPSLALSLAKQLQAWIDTVR